MKEYRDIVIAGRVKVFSLDEDRVSGPLFRLTGRTREQKKAGLRSYEIELFYYPLRKRILVNIVGKSKEAVLSLFPSAMLMDPLLSDAISKNEKERGFPVKDAISGFYDEDGAYLRAIRAKKKIEPTNNEMRLKRRVLNAFADEFGCKTEKELSKSENALKIADFFSNGRKRNSTLKYMTVTSMAFEGAIKEEKLTLNPIKKAMEYISSEERIEKAILEISDLKSLIMNSDNWMGRKDVRLEALMIALTGLRIGEAAAIDKSSLIRESGVPLLLIDKAIDSDMRISKTKTRRARKVPCPEFLFSLLQRAVESGDMPFFRRQAFASALRSAVGKIGHSDITPHSLRHGYISIMASAGLEDSTLSLIIGHATASMQSAMNHLYTHQMISGLKKALRIAEGIFSEGEKEALTRLLQ